MTDTPTPKFYKDPQTDSLKTGKAEVLTYLKAVAAEADTDKDGKLSPDELAKLKFGKFDDAVKEATKNLDTLPALSGHFPKVPFMMSWGMKNGKVEGTPPSKAPLKTVDDVNQALSDIVAEAEPSADRVLSLGGINAVKLLLDEYQQHIDASSAPPTSGLTNAPKPPSPAGARRP